MEIDITENYQKLSGKAAEIIKNEISKKPDIVLGLATGSTPVGCYKKLVKMHESGEVDFSKVIVFNLDEYLGLSADNSQSYHYFMKKHLIDKVNIKKKNFNIPNGKAENPKKHSEEYEKRIKEAGGIDLQILGIGANGHIGFNEPGSSFNSKTRPVDLKEKTIKSNARFFKSGEDVPRKAITMGLGTILEAKRIILMASGKGKAKICKRFLKGPVDQSVPATALKNHKNVLILLDKEAASKL